jgi:hypothetical protein
MFLYGAWTRLFRWGQIHYYGHLKGLTFEMDFPHQNHYTSRAIYTTGTLIMLFIHNTPLPSHPCFTGLLHLFYFDPPFPPPPPQGLAVHIGR